MQRPFKNVVKFKEAPALRVSLTKRSPYPLNQLTLHKD
jgi:hypothetical protein